METSQPIDATPPSATTAWRALRGRLSDAASLVATPLRPSHYLELINPLWATHRLRARVERVEDETAEARTLTLRPGRGWRRHRAGQFVRLGVTIGGLRHTRTYSISSPPESGDGCFTITVKAMAGGRVSGFLVRTLSPGAYLPIGLPEGEFVLPETTSVRPLFITAGSGITPVMSMLRSVRRRPASPDIVHIHYAPQACEVIFRAELEAMAAQVTGYRLFPIYTRSAAPAERRSEHFSGAQLDALCPDWREREVWACGPQSLLDAIEKHWHAAGLSERVHVERFGAPLLELPNDSTGGTVRFAASGRTVQADGRTPLLRAAEAAGLNPPHGCRMGICHTCDATLLAGCVRDLRTGARCSEAGRRVQICVNAAAGDVELAL